LEVVAAAAARLGGSVLSSGRVQHAWREDDGGSDTELRAPRAQAKVGGHAAYLETAILPKGSLARPGTWLTLA
jgi:hypothetical protein